MVRSRSETNLNRIFLDLCTNPELRTHGHMRHNQRQYNPPLPTLKPIKSISCSDLTKTVQDAVQSSSIDDTQIETLDLTIPLQLPQSRSKESIACTTLTAASLIPMESTGFTVQISTCSTDRSISLFETTLTNSTEEFHEQYSSFQTKYSPLQNSSNNKKIQTKSVTDSTEKSHEQYSLFQANHSPLQNSSHNKKSRTISVIDPTEKPHEQYSSFETEHSLLQNSSINDKNNRTISLITTPSNDKKQQDYTNRLRDRLKSRGHLRKFFLS